ncbi:hypothetical protein PT974_02365 [Cladobotryum mycophilum]|uniref:AT DNA binding protein n=1 Tax=Cladobotryum mycophilum TaxID=491253 RepID=A0ABR0SXV6_9HYPO
MPRRRKSGFLPQSFNLRWHSIADPTTPSVDLMSSPDPLNDPTLVIESATRRVTRSQRSQRFASFETSPRRRIYELEAGDDTSPEESTFIEDTTIMDSGGTRRKLFRSPGQSPTMRRIEQATTTTIPLRGSIEEAEEAESLLTPRRRGRPRKPNGTPMPKSGVKRRAGTPIQASPRRRRNAGPSEGDAVDAPFEGTIELDIVPKSARRGRPPKNRPTESPGELGASAQKTGTARTRRLAMLRDELVEEAAANRGSMQEAPFMSENDVDLIHAPSERSFGRAAADAGSPAPSNAESDIWMAATDDQPTPRAANQAPKSVLTGSPSRPAYEPTPPESDDHAVQGDDYGYLAPAGSDKSDVSEPLSERDPLNNDTIAQGEDFSMIFMDSIPSLAASFHGSRSFHGNSSMMRPAEEDEELGDETNLIINNTLETIRQEVAQSDASDITESADAGDVTIMQETSFTEVLSPSAQREAGMVPRLSPSTWWSRKPKKMGSSPLRRQVLRSSMKKASLSAVEIVAMRHDHDTPTRNPRQAVVANLHNEDSNMYEDSFSEIPQNVLAAATPAPSKKVPQLNDQDAQMEDAHAEVESQQELEPEVEPEPEPEPEQNHEIEEEQEADAEEEEEEEEEGDHGAQDDDEQATEDEMQHDTEEEQQSEQTEAMKERSSSPFIDEVQYPTLRRLSTPEIVYPQPSTEAAQDLAPATAEPAISRSKSPHEQEEDQHDVDENVDENMHETSESPEQPHVDDEVSEQPIKVTPLNQMSSPIQDPQSVVQKAVHEMTSRPRLSSIVQAGRVLQSVTSDPPSPGDRNKQLGSPFRSSGSKESLQAAKDIYSNRLMSKSPPRPLNLGQSQAAPRNQTQSSSRLTDFGANEFHGITSKPTLDDRIAELGDDNRQPSQESAGSSMRITPPDDETMSWVENEGPLSPSLRGDNTLREATRLSAAARSIKPTVTREPVVREPVIREPVVREPVVRKPVTREPIVREPPVKEPVIRQPIAVGQIDGVGEETEEESQADDETDIWEFEARRSPQEQSIISRAPAPEPRPSAIPKPWTSKNGQRASALDVERTDEQSTTDDRTTKSTTRTGVADEVEDYSMISHKQPQNEADSAKGSRFDLSNFFSSPAAIPGMLAQKLFPTSKPKAPELKPKRLEPRQQAASGIPTSSMFPQVPPKTFASRHSHRTDLFSPVQSKGAETKKQQVVERSTPEQDEPSIIAQKQNFTPQPKQTNQAFFFPSSARTAATVTPPRMQLSHEDIHRWQQETSNASEASPDVPRHVLRPLPAKNASPIKSSLRSPLKPRTPGRVVEFTSSVLSPLDQAVAREQRRQANSTISHEPLAPVDPPAPAVSQIDTSSQVNTRSQETEDTTIPEAPKPSDTEPPQPERLSQTTWTRKHWLLLDSLMQFRKKKSFTQRHEKTAEKLLGKTVKSQGKALTLERWHLDCVDAFKAEVGGWDEAVLAKRLFALILGEERRQRRMAKKAQRVVFH